METELENYIKENEKINCKKCQDTQYVYDESRNRRKACSCVGEVPEGGYKSHLTTREITEGFKKRYLPIRLHDTENFEYTVDKIKSKDNEIYNWELSFSTYKRILKGIYNSLALGNTLTKNHLIVAPKGYGKTDFIYACMIRGYEAGLNVSKIISIKEITQKINKKEYTFLEDLFISKDIVFINLGRHIEYEDIKGLQYMLDISERKEKPMVVISNLPIKSLVGSNGSFATDIQKKVKSGYFNSLQVCGFSDEQMVAHFKKNINKTKTNKLENGEIKEEDLLDINSLTKEDKIDKDEEFNFKEYKDNLKG